MQPKQRRSRILLAGLALLFASTPLPGQSTPSPRALYESGMERLEAGDVYAAIEHFADAVAGNDGFARAHLGLARAYGELGELDQALQHAQRARRLAPGDSEAITVLAALRIDLGEPEEARRLYESVLAEEPNNPAARLGLAELAVAQGDFDEAARRYETVRQGSPQNRRALLSLALLWEQRGVRETAERYIDLALRYHGNDAQVRLQAASYYLRSGDLQRARRNGQIALQIREDLHEARYILAALSFAREDYETARQAAEELLDVDSSDTRAWYVHALSQYRLGELNAALQSFRTALRLVPESEILRFAYEDVLIRELPSDTEERSNAAGYHFERGAYLEDQNLFARARAAYRRGLLLDPFSVDGRREYAEIFRYRGLSATYLNELQVLESLAEEVPQSVSDRIEAYDSVLAESVARNWGVDQFTISRNPVTIGLYVVGADGLPALPEEGRILAGALRRELLGYEILDIPTAAREVESFSRAFSDARNRDLDYFLPLEFQSSDRSIRFSGDLYAARTGTAVASVHAGRSGADRISRALLAFSDDLVSRLPVAGRILQRQGSRLLVSIGRLHGLEVESELLVVRPASMILASEEPLYVFPEEDVLGTARVSRLDDLLAEADLADPGLFDLVRPGDRVVFTDDRGEPPGETELFPVIYDRIRRLR